MFSGGLWRRAARAGCHTAEEKRAFGAADDVYAAGLVVAFLCFVPFCKPGAVDGGALQRLFEGTFALDFDAIRCVYYPPACLQLGLGCDRECPPALWTLLACLCAQGRCARAGAGGVPACALLAAGC